MAKIYNNSPYLEYYDKAKGYVKLLAVPERGAQSVEWNIMQSMMLAFIKDIGDSIYQDGNIVEGCSFSISDNTVKIESGRIYMDGLIHNIEGATLRINGTGTEFIGVVLEEEIVTEEEDSQFYDPAVGSANYLHPGCHRVKQSVHFEANNPLSAVVATFIDGNIKTITEERPVTDTMTEVLARRTFDESGNYVVSGFDMFDGNNELRDTLLVNLNKGKAYVKGYEINRPVGTSFRIRKSTDHTTMLNEPHVVSSSSNTYRLINIPVKQVNRVSVSLTTTETMTRGQVSGTTDSPSKGPIVSITSIVSGSTTYTPGYDYVLTDNKVDWSPSGKEPDPGANYTITYVYKSVLTEDTDYRVVQTDDFCNIVVLNNSLVAGTEMLVDYDYYLARKDSICMDRNGNVVISEGQPNFPLLASAPQITDNSVLKIGEILCMPNSSKMVIVNTTIKVSTMDKIQKAIERVKDLEYNLSVTNLDKEAMAGEVITDLKGVFTDGFINFNKIDVGRDDVDFTLDGGRLLLPMTDSTTDLSINQSSPLNRYSTYGTNWTCPYTETMVISQPLATDAMKVNPWQSYPEPQVPTVDPVPNPENPNPPAVDPPSSPIITRIMSMEISPTVDNWINENVITVENINRKSNQITRWWYWGRNPNSRDARIMQEAGIDISNWQGQDATFGGVFSGPVNDFNSSASMTNDVITSTQRDIIEESASLYMRQTTIKVTSETLVKDESVHVEFGGIMVKLTPLGTTTQGVSDYQVKADSDGKIECTFEVPANMPCGTVDVRLVSDNMTNRFASCSYVSEGREQTVQETIYITRNVITVVDPLAQTFSVDETCNITSVDLYFVDKGEEGYPARVQLRGTSNGYPNSIVYSEVLLENKDIKTSDNASIPTRVTFPNPVLCESDSQYCIVIMTDSPTMSLAICTLGSADMVNSQWILSNPYSAGVLFSSSNSLTWTAHQDKDLKFNLYRADYQSTGTLIFNNISLNSIDRFMLAVDSVVPVGCKAEFEVSVNNGAFHPYEPWVDYNLSLNATTAAIKVNLISTGYLSPIISSVTPKAYSSKNKTTCTYISKNIVMDTPFNSIKVYMDVINNSAFEYHVYYATDTHGQDWNEIPLSTSKSLTSNSSQNYYETSLASPATDYRVKVVMSTTQSYLRPSIKRLMNVLRDV